MKIAAIFLLLSASAVGFIVFQSPFSLRNSETVEAAEASEPDKYAIQPPLPANLDRDKVVLHIRKADYEMDFLYQDSILKTYPVVFGPDPVKAKIRQGDGCTPEGTFHIRSKYPHKSWSYFLWVDYPNVSSWEKFRAAIESGTIPETSTIGGDIGIHGVPEGKDFLIREKINWTLGCISLTTAGIAEIYPHIQEGTEIRID